MPDAPNTIETATPGKLRLLLVDVTGNKHGFEHELSAEIYQLMKNSGVELASENPVIVDDHEGLAARFPKPDETFNALLLLAHGDPDPGDGTASEVVDFDRDWYLLAALLPDLRDKLVCLAVCYGSCEDSVEALTKGEMFALTLVAPILGLSEDEVRAFFPAFFDELNQLCALSIPPEVVKRCVHDNNHLANDKFRVR